MDCFRLMQRLLPPMLMVPSHPIAPWILTNIICAMMLHFQWAIHGWFQCRISWREVCGLDVAALVVAVDRPELQSSHMECKMALLPCSLHKNLKSRHPDLMPFLINQSRQNKTNSMIRAILVLINTTSIPSRIPHHLRPLQVTLQVLKTEKYFLQTTDPIWHPS